MNKMTRESILQMGRGAFAERADYEMRKVIDNILDLNTKATAKRKITQLVVLPVAYPDVVQAEEITGGPRGDDGYGSTGR